MKVSIITPCYNSSDSIEDCLSSILNQNYEELEHVIIDGKSTDNTINIINSFNDVSRILVSEKDSGIYEAINKGINLSNGKIIGILHSDDRLGSKKIISEIVEIFNSNSNIQILYGNLLYTNYNFSRIIRTWKSKKYKKNLLSYGWMPPHPTVYVRKEIFQEIGYYNKGYKISGDYDFLIRLFKKYGKQSYYLNSDLYYMRIGGVSNNKISNIIRKMNEDYKIIKNNKIGGLSTLIFKNLRKVSQFFNI